MIISTLTHDSEVVAVRYSFSRLRERQTDMSYPHQLHFSHQKADRIKKGREKKGRRLLFLEIKQLGKDKIMIF
ncbi:hypothetical protein NC651_013059 [Populus alba x Populus x berolinensis]|nr:hypothetical protein NC651_013059 [Populus alba x Populus x berolinensis]